MCDTDAASGPSGFGAAADMWGDVGLKTSVERPTDRSRPSKYDFLTHREFFTYDHR